MKLYHYTNQAGLSGILATNTILPSTRSRNPRDARFGDGQYLTDIMPGSKRPGQLSRIFLGHPFAGKRFSHRVVFFMASYIHARWRAAPPDSPVEFYSELDPQRYETRKIEIFADGRVGHASSRGATQDTRLAIEPLPTIVEIRAEGDFDIKEITKAAFDAQWKATGAR